MSTSSETLCLHSDIIIKHVSLDFKISSMKRPLFFKRICCSNIYASNFFSTRFGGDFERDEVDVMEFVAINK